MIQHRVRGISNLVVACEGVFTLLLFWIWTVLYQTFVPGGDGINLVSYAGYSVLRRESGQRVPVKPATSRGQAFAFAPIVILYRRL
jgi:hypothetical protein